MRRRGRRAGAARALLAVVVAGLVGACGVEVPDDVAARATTTATTAVEQPATTAPPTSDDPLEQALLDNGYTAEEARCGAERLRQVLDDDEVQEIVEADSLDDIDSSTASRFADALSDCVEGGADPGDDDGNGNGNGDDDSNGDDPDQDDGAPVDPSDPPGRRGGPRRPNG